MNHRNKSISRPNIPFIKKFKVEESCYVYDVNSNQIIEVEQPVYDIIDEYDQNNDDKIELKYKNKYPISTIKHSIDEILAAKEKLGIFSNFKPQLITMGVKRTESIKKIHEKGLNQILLELTRKCNLNCSYCRTSGKYRGSLSNESEMSRNIWKKALDFFHEKSLILDKAYITFYGGEPLIRFSLIEESIEYLRKKENGERFEFNLTTNGTLLNNEMLDFFIRNDVKLMVSLDGPEKVNDRYRITKEGTGSFNIIMKNLETIRSKAPGFFSSNISISTVLSPPFDHIEDTLDFFSKNELFNDIKARNGIRSTLVYTNGISFIEDFGLEESMDEYKKVFKRFFQRYKDAIFAHDINGITIEHRGADAILYNLSHRTIRQLRSHTPPLGPCHIGLRRLFVSTNGDFYICERSGGDYKIGHIDSGFDYDRITHYYRKLDEVLKDCRDCWALSHCERCWVSLGNLKEFKGKVKEQFCHSRRNFIEKAFKLYVSLLREDPECLKVLKNAD